MKPPPDPIMIDGEQHFEVKAILDSHTLGENPVSSSMEGLSTLQTE